MLGIGATIVLTIALAIIFYKLYTPKIKTTTFVALCGLMAGDILVSNNLNFYLLVPLTLVNFLLVGFYENTQLTTYNILISILCFLVFLINDAISFIMLNKILGFDYTKSLYGILVYGVVNIALAYLHSSVVSKSLNMLIKEKVSLKHGKKSLVIIFNIIFSFLIIYLSYYINKVYIGYKGKAFSIIYLLLIIGYLASTIGTAYFFYLSYKREMKIKLDEEEKKRIIEYSTMIDDMYMTIRKFKHDYINILASINSYIDDKQWEELEVYFKENILTTRQIVAKNDSISKLHNLKVIYLKALISSKIIKAESLGIKTYIDISEMITKLDVNPVDICRTIGILLDNAIEGTLESDEKILRFGMVYKGNSVVIIIENSCSTSIPPIYKMLEKNFSTKGEDRGLGLYNLKEILSKYTNITYTLNAENSLFSSEIWIRNTKIDS